MWPCQQIEPMVDKPGLNITGPADATYFAQNLKSKVDVNIFSIFAALILWLNAGKKKTLLRHNSPTRFMSTLYHRVFELSQTWTGRGQLQATYSQIPCH